jgi:adenosylcobyric acid synthase
LEPGLRFLEERTKKPVLGVVPYFPNLNLEAEDSVSLEAYRKRQPPFPPATTVNVAVVCLPHIANFTDFMPLARVEGATLNYVTTPGETSGADIIILPGSKDTIADLHWLKKNGWGRTLEQMRAKGAWIVGVCGGYQMLGQEIADPLGVEGEQATEEGLGLLPLRTVFAAIKTTRKVEAKWSIGPEAGVFLGYEIHMGQTSVSEGTIPRFLLRSVGRHQWEPDGAVSLDGRVWGTYLHGLFASGSFLRAWLSQVGAERGIRVRVGWQEWERERNLHLDYLANALQTHLDLTAIRGLARVS